MPKTQKVRVLFLISNRWNSAISEYALSAAEALRRKGFVTGFVTLEQAPVGRRAKLKGHELFTVKDFSLFRLVSITKMIRAFAPHAVFSFGGPETALASLLRSFSNWSLFRFRGQDSDMKVDQEGFGFRQAHRGVDAIVVPNAFLQHKYQRMFQQPVHLVPLGMDETKFHPREHSLEERKNLLLVGRLDPVKGHQEFFPIFFTAKTQTPMHLEMIGEAANLSAQQITGAAVGAGLKEQQDFDMVTKRIEDLPDRMSKALGGIISSLDSEVICRVGVEFLLSGAPIFVSGVGALDELLFAQAGESYKSLSKDEAAEKLVAFVRQSMNESMEERKKRAEKAREEFSLERMGQRLAHLFMSGRL